jgi:hypothetical protein
MIPLSNGKSVIVDDEDYEALKLYKWCFGGGGYAQRHTSLQIGKRKTILMHRQIMNTPDGLETDHINGNGLDNRKENLRICTKNQNQMNRRLPCNNQSGYKGVSWYSRDGRWRAQIKLNSHLTFIGTYETAMEAARAYDEKAKEYFGEFAKLNF